MDGVRYVIGVILIVGLPPAVAMWLLVHPLARFWRRVGPRVTYVVIAGVFAASWVFLYRARDELLGRDFGTNWVLFALGLVPYGVSIWLTVLTRRHLTFKTLAGGPELATSEAPGTLLQEGIYSAVRHPRYLSVILGMSGLAMISNHVGAYVMSVATVPALLLVIALEERELEERLGPAYAAYRTQVPMLVPRRRRRSQVST